MIGTGTKAVELVTTTLSKASGVKPVSGPTLTVGGTSQQCVDYFLVRLGGCVTDKRSNLFGCWRQSDQIKIGATNQFLFAGCMIGFQSMSVLSLPQKTIDRFFGVGRSNLSQRLKGPPCLSFFDINLSFGRQVRVAHARIGGSHFDPLCEVRDYIFGQFAGGRHLDAVVHQCLDKQTLGRLAFD